MKKLLSVLLALLTVMGIGGVSAFAMEDDIVIYQDFSLTERWDEAVIVWDALEGYFEHKADEKAWVYWSVYNTSGLAASSSNPLQRIESSNESQELLHIKQGRTRLHGPLRVKLTVTIDGGSYESYKRYETYVDIVLQNQDGLVGMVRSVDAILEKSERYKADYIEQLAAAVAAAEAALAMPPNPDTDLGELYNGLRALRDAEDRNYYLTGNDTIDSIIARPYYIIANLIESQFGGSLLRFILTAVTSPIIIAVTLLLQPVFFVYFLLRGLITGQWHDEPLWKLELY